MYCEAFCQGATKEVAAQLDLILTCWRETSEEILGLRSRRVACDRDCGNIIIYG